MARFRPARLAAGACTLAGVLLLWYASTSLTGWIGPARFPEPVEVWDALRQITVAGYADGRLDQHVLHSCALVLMGFAAATAVGVPLGLWMGHSRRAEAFFNPIFMLIRPIPPLAWIPLAIVWLGLEDASKVMVIWFAAFVPSVINSYVGVRSIERPVLEAAAMLEVRGARFVREVVVPGALPHVFTGLRLSLQASWTTLVAAELIGALFGLGHVLTQGSLDIYPAMILVAMMAVALCGGLMTAALTWLEQASMPWRFKA